jgi:uncharacterized protein YvpB
MENPKKMALLRKGRRGSLNTRAALIILAGLIIYVAIVTIGQLNDSKKQIAQTNPINESTSIIVTPLNTATATVSNTPTLIITMLPTITSTLTPIPASHYLEIDAHGKYFYLGCEAAAAVDLAGFYDVLIYQYNFQHELPLSDNPDMGFVGDANGPWGQVPPYAYGVHAAPVAALLQQYSVDAVGGKGYSLEQMKEKLAAGHPVIVWVIGNMIGGVPAEYTDSQGNTTIVAAYEHVVILTGYDEDSVRYVNNGRFFEVPNKVFLNSWGVLGNMAVFHR